MTKDCRLTVRITGDLDTWLEAEGHKRGLDKAAFARMALFERMNGQPPITAVTLVPKNYSRDILSIASPPQNDAFEIMQGVAIGDIPSHEGVPIIDVDDLVNSSLADAEEQGLTQRVEREPSPEQVGGVRAIVRPPSRFSAANQPGWINQQ